MADVLVVEDDFLTRNNISKLLNKSGYEVLSAENGEEALSIIRNKTPDLIISDILMPGIDGLTLFSSINGEDSNEHIPFIFLTGRTEIADLVHGMQLGADDYITKPFKAHDLLKSVETRLRKKARNIQKLESFKSIISRNISHEFRTPLIPIIEYSQIIRENYWQMEPKEILEMTQKICSSGNGILRLVERFLLLVELEENMNTKTENKTSVNKAVNSCVVLAASAEGRKEDIIINVTEEQVIISENDLKMILTELINNAVKFSTPGSPLEISSENLGDKCIVTVSDFGKGMTHEQVNCISSFLQSSRQRMHRPSPGLGLAIVRKLAEKNSIGVCIESELGLFTRVSLSLPV